MSTVSCEDLDLHNYLSLCFSNYPKLFNCVHINAQSLANDDHLSNFSATFGDCPVSAILVSETWLKPNIPNTRVKLPGYNLIRNDRVYSGGGGVAIYLKEGFQYNVLKTSNGNVPSIEFILIEAWCSGSKFLLGVFYRSPKIHTFLDEFEALLMDYLPHYSDVVLLGDMNCNLLKSDATINGFKNVLSSVNMDVLPTEATYHIPTCDSLLDVMMVLVPRKVKHFGIRGAPAFSHHDLLHLSYDMRCPKSQHKIIQYRDYKNLNVEILADDARKEDWGGIRRCDSVDEKVSRLTGIISSLYEKHVPLKTSRIRRPPAPWFTDEIKLMMKRRDRVHATFRRTKSLEHWDRYRRLRNVCNRLVRDSRRKDIAQNVKEGHSAVTWKYLKSLGVTDDGADLSSSNLPLDVNALNNFFVKPPITVRPDIKESTLSAVRSENSPDCEKFSFSHVTDDQVLQSLNNTKSNAVGNDQVVLKFVKHISFVVVPSLSHIFNFSLLKGIFPSCWKESIVVPLPKVQEPKEASDFRPISILPLFSKVFERVVNEQVSYYLQKHRLLSPFQSGFRAGHSTSTALLKVTEDVRLSMDKKMVTILLLLDFSKAFDTVDHDILLARLSSSFNFSHAAVSWFQSYLSRRKQCVRVRGSNSSSDIVRGSNSSSDNLDAVVGASQIVGGSNHFSDYLDVVAGVPQGSVLAPLLFSMFINPVTHIFRHCSFHMYADDLQLYIHSTVDEFENKIALMNEDLRSLLEWTNLFGIIPNPRKFQAITIGSSVLLSRLDLSSTNLMFNETVIPFSDTVKNLGVIIDSTLSWVPHVHSICKKCFSSLYSLNKLRRLLPFNVKKLLCSSLIFPIVEYADVVYQSLNNDLKGKIQKIQNACVRFVFGLRKFDHVSMSRDSLHWMTFEKRRGIHMLRLVWRILNHSQPSYLIDLFNVLGSRESESRSNNRGLLQIPMHRTNFVSNSFAVQSIRRWNELPAEIRISISFATFKRELDILYEDSDI